jgi:D-aspartate ligase
MSAQIPAAQPFVPVITGGDLGAYSLAREFHEAFGVMSAVVPTAENLIVGGSKLTQLFPAGQMFDADHVVHHLQYVAHRLRETSPRPLILLPGYDHLVRIVVERSEELRSMGYLFPELTSAQLDQAALKTQFYALCETQGIKYPRTASFDCSQGTGTVDEFVSTLTAPTWQYPLILKAGDGSAWANTRFEGRRKVHYLTEATQLVEVLTRAIEAGYKSDLIIQQFIPGPDSNLRILTHFRDRHGANVLTGLAQVIVEDHAPGLEGNARAVVAASDSAIEAQGAQLMDATNWHGFGMFDIKIHQDTGEPYFLEMNPRLGRHHYYLTVAEANPAEYLYRELIEKSAHPAPVVTGGPAVSTTIPLKLAREYASKEQQVMLDQAKRSRRIGWPLQYSKDRNFKRDLYQRYRLTKAAAEVAHTPGTMND